MPDLGRVAYEAYSGDKPEGRFAEWDDLPDEFCEAWRKAALAVAEMVRRADAA